MTRFPLTQFVTCISAIFLAQSSLASGLPTSNDTLYGTSILWDDEAGKTRLLESAPAWNDQTLKSLFEAYRHPEKYDLPHHDSTQQNNVQFINSFWGPLDNPFNKFPRPAKVFIFIDKASQPADSSSTLVTHFMAPLIKNQSDGNYYVFDKDHSQPELLSDWINEIKASHPAMTVRFNLCNGYGDLPSDSCSTKSYQSEVSDTEPSARFAASLSKQKEMSSASRGIHEDWTLKAKSARKLTLASSDTILGGSIDWKNAVARNRLLATTSSWPDFKTIQASFEKIRDIRYFDDEKAPGFKRRISWLYPDDGCWTRASAAIRDLFGPFNNAVNETVRPSKVFVFGNLCANTSNSPEGRVTWWYHTAPIIKDAETNQTYVLDPSINPYKPLAMEKWVEEITSQTGACAEGNNYIKSFNICNGYGSGPYSSCQDSYQNETSAMMLQPTYRYYERERQVELGRNADAVLGDLPPWKNPVN